MAALVLFYMRGQFGAVHLKKDVGLFPLYLKKEYFDSAEIVKIGTDDKTDYSTEELKVINLFYEPRVNDDLFQHSKKFELKCVWKSFLYLLKHKEFTHIMMFNVTRYTLGLSFLVKLLMPKRKIYLKLDANTKIAETLSLPPKSFRLKLFYRLVSCADIISVETSQNYEIIKRNPFFEKKLFLVPNGFEKTLEFDDSAKENMIISVARFGSYPKNTELLLSALADLNMQDWKVYLIGSIEKEEQNFEIYIQNFFENHSHLKNSIIFTGNISDKTILDGYYKKAKVFILPSKYESFGIATIEAASYGDYLVLTDVGCARDIIRDDTFGYIIPESGENSQIGEKLKKDISSVLQKIVDGKIDVERDMQKRLDYINSRFSMQNIVKLPVFREWGK